MLKVFFGLLIAVMVGGCAMPNDDIVAETKKCEEAGMQAVAHRNGYTMRVVMIQCEPKLYKGE